MDGSDIASLFALLFSFLALCLGIWNRISNERRSDSNLYLARYHNVEVNLASWHEALRFYDIDVAKAKRENITPEMIAYLILYINSINAKCKANNTTIKEECLNSKTRQRIFSNQDTLTTWQFSKKAFGEDVVDGIDQFISSQDLTKPSI